MNVKEYIGGYIDYAREKFREKDFRADFRQYGDHETLDWRAANGSSDYHIHYVFDTKQQYMYISGDLGAAVCLNSAGSRRMEADMKQTVKGLQMVTTATTPRDVIKRRADEKHIKLGDLARKAGIPQRTFSSRLADGRWDTFQLNQLMHYIDLHPEDIMFLIENAA